MDRKVIFAGKIQPGISKSKNCLEIINEINTFKIKKEMKEILFLAVMKIFPDDKRNKDIIFHLESFKRNGRIYPEFSSSKYVQNIINEVKQLSDEDFKKYVEKLIEFVTINEIEFTKIY
nr:hypothetical protein [Clostridia bacterium]